MSLLVSTAKNQIKAAIVDAAKKAMEENIFPSGGFLASETEIEEERRLFYVAMTRAKKQVQFAFASTRMRN